MPAEERARIADEYRHLMHVAGDHSVIHPIIQQDRSIGWFLARSHCTLASDGTPFRMAGVLIDITDQRRLEDQLRQSQKMEAVGQLTGGLAHDFNNMLQGISGNLELIKAKLDRGQLTNVPRYISSAQSAADRAASVTQRLLAFSRRQVLAPEIVDANPLIADMSELIRHTVGPEITMQTVPAEGLWATLCDASQMENSLLNLCINARDAMPQGGKLTIETANMVLAQRDAREWDMMPGNYITVCVTDTGTGMPPEVAARAFDPFFTTKPLGSGTGLGLSMIHGFANQSGGQVQIHSKVGIGTTVRIFLPQHLGEVTEKQSRSEMDDAPLVKAGETVLIVDDEPSVRILVSDALQEQGYAVIEAEDGASGLKVLQSAARIDLLISDVGLSSGMNGRQMADAARVSRPALKVLFITGYAAQAVFEDGRLEYGMQVITKPFAMDVLASKVKTMVTA